MAVLYREWNRLNREQQTELLVKVKGGEPAPFSIPAKDMKSIGMDPRQIASVQYETALDRQSNPYNAPGSTIGTTEAAALDAQVAARDFNPQEQYRGSSVTANETQRNIRALPKVSAYEMQAQDVANSLANPAGSMTLDTQLDPILGPEINPSSNASLASRGFQMGTGEPIQGGLGGGDFRQSAYGLPPTDYGLLSDAQIEYGQSFQSPVDTLPVSGGTYDMDESNAMAATLAGGTTNQTVIGSTPEVANAVKASTKTSSTGGTDWGMKGLGGTLLGAGQLGLGIASYFDTKKQNKKSRELMDQQIASNKYSLAATKKFRGDVSNAFA